MAGDDTARGGRRDPSPSSAWGERLSRPSAVAFLELAGRAGKVAHRQDVELVDVIAAEGDEVAAAVANPRRLPSA